MFDFNLMYIVAGLPGLIIAMVVHEYAHAQVAVWLGDFTPRMMGRLTLDPRAHVDPIGMIMLLVAHFGWAKPVMINPHNFKEPRRDDILVSLAGPVANLITAFIALLFLCILSSQIHDKGGILVFKLITEYNICFAIFNLIPLPPLDGSHVLKQLLPRDLAYHFESLERYSFILLILILILPIPRLILLPMMQYILDFFYSIIVFLF
ncbi:site-2 protease family protein [Selenomonas ruminis]|uniref:Site-2 protease family protein n=1 Tax=Selenomonas ruminis TaxID=2593411 RepID=A0A5D6WCJ5_9FIRM|nr:site-2 protease family protein [Selenomonas sp. mPRGC5]TYZ24749.1 site-2 protease family protein [Selenomonas sp. mPRGC5]